MRPATAVALAAIATLGACASDPIVGADTTVVGGDTTGVALMDLGSRTYKGFRGGLYPGGSAAMPAEHAARGAAAARAIRPLDAAGNPSASGKIVLLSVGMSNTSQEFCGSAGTGGGTGGGTGCTPESFMALAAADLAVNRPSLVPVNGAQGGRVAGDWVSPTSTTYVEVRNRLNALGLTEQQVQVVWLKQANAGPTRALPDTSADAYRLERALGDVVRTLKVRYPNLQQVYLSNRIYAGYATTTLNPEPYAFETGFAVKWLVQAQIDQMRTGSIVDARAGDLRSDGGVAPWIAWGPDLWANGMTPRSDGLTYARGDLVNDGTHPSVSGRQKVATQLLAFFKAAPASRCWFLAGQTC